MFLPAGQAEKLNREDKSMRVNGKLSKSLHAIGVRNYRARRAVALRQVVEQRQLRNPCPPKKNKREPRETVVTASLSDVHRVLSPQVPWVPL